MDDVAEIVRPEEIKRAEVKLSVENVGRITLACLTETPDNTADCLTVEGFTRSFVFSQRAIDTHREEIISMISQVPKAFTFQGLGAESITKLGVDVKGKTWTDNQAVLEDFCCLAIALGQAAWIGSQDMWTASPSGVPYVIFGDVSDVIAPKPRRSKTFALNE